MAQDKKKIIVVAPAHPYRGGQALDEAYLYHIISDMGYDYFCISYTLLYPSLLFPGKTQYDSSEVINYEHKDNIKRILSSINPITWLKTYKEIKNQKPDVVIFLWWMFFFGPCLGFVAWMLRKRQKEIKVCFLADNYISHEEHFWERIIVKRTFKQAQYFIAPSEYISKEIKKDFPLAPVCTTTLSVYDCYNLHRYDKQSARDFLNIKTKEVILFFGLIRPYKGLDRLIEAFKEIKRDRKDITLLIAGECYGDIKVYTDKIKEYGLEDSVMLVNQYIANEDIEPYFIASDLVALPYYSATQSGVVMTAYAFRRPVVVTDVGGIKEEVLQNSTGIVIKDNSADNLIKGITEILDNKETIDYSANIESFIDTFGNQKLKEFLQSI
ncbi:MAG: glycosyltransferase family 4 protein [Bacteroidales bacterium]|nr:glycosyltransferase family 4 protein [Bacteroidales bacterium]MBP3254793.1 glycosyltransferase family 4 protein [Bacteroidales bacterium]